MARKKASLDSNSLSSSTAAFRHELAVETDRGKALVGAAFLDDALKALIIAYLVQDNKCLERIMNPDGLAGSFSSRIVLATLLGLIDGDTHHDLDVVRRIRNEFAHRHGPSSFDDAHVGQICNQFRWVYAQDVGSARERFLAVVCVLAGWLSSLAKMFETQRSGGFPGPPRIAAQLVEQARKRQVKVVRRAFSGNEPC